MDVQDFRLDVSATKQHRSASAPTFWSTELWNACFLPCIKCQVLSGFCSVCLVEGRQNYPELHKPKPATPGKAATPDIDWVMNQGLSPVPLALRLRLPAWLHLIHPPARNVKRSTRITAASERDLRDNVVEAAAALLTTEDGLSFYSFTFFLFSARLACRYIDQRRQWFEKPNSQALGSSIWWLAWGLKGGTGREPDTFQTVFLSQYPDTSTTLPLKPVKKWYFFPHRLWSDTPANCMKTCGFYFSPLSPLQFSVLVKQRHSRHFVLYFDLWRRGLGGGRGDGVGVGGCEVGSGGVRGCGGKNSERRLLSATTVPRWRRE